MSNPFQNNPPNEPPPGDSSPAPARITRRGAAIVAAVAVGMFALNTVLLHFEHAYYPVLYVFAPPALLVGVFWVVRPPNDPSGDGPPEPLWAKLMVGVCILAGLALGGLLAWDPDMVFRWFGFIRVRG
jgi:hypothetical protein